MQVRRPTFDLTDSVPHFGDNAAACNVVNGGGVIPPPIERYLIKVMRKAKAELDPMADADLLADVAVFNGQEGQHFKLHNEMLEMLATKGYPRIREYEAAFEADLERFLVTEDLAWNLAYCEGFESAGTALAAGWIDGHVKALCADDGSVVMDLWMWHLAEEFEHRSVVHDVLERLYGRERAHELRTTIGEFARGHYAGYAAEAVGYLFEVDRAAMTADGRAASEAGEQEAWLALAGFAGDAFGWIHDPAYDPAKVDPPAGYAAILARYS